MGRLLGLLAAAAFLAGAAAPSTAAAASFDLGQVGFGTLAVDDAHQHVFLAAPTANAVYEFDFAGNLLATVPNVYGAWGMTADSTYLYVTESTVSKIMRINLTTLTPQDVGATGLIGPRWLVMTGGKLWTTVGTSPAKVVSVDPTNGTTTTPYGSYSGADLAVSPGLPHTLFIASDGGSPGAIYRLDVSTTPPTPTAQNTSTDQSNIEGLVVSPDGTRVIPASGAPYLFEELSASMLTADGVSYPGQPYPSAVAVSASGLLATGLNNGYSAPDIGTYQLGAPAPTWTWTTNNPDGTANVVPHGLALSADGSVLFAVTSSSSGHVVFNAVVVGSKPPPPPPSNPGPSQPGPTVTQPKPAPPQPPHLQITPKNPRSGRPDISLYFSAVRESLVRPLTHTVVGYRFFFEAKNIKCINGATNIIFTIGRSRRTAPCVPGPILIGKPVAPDRTYNIRIQAVRMRRHRIAKRGASYSGRLYMPGNGAPWTPIPSLPPAY